MSFKGGKNSIPEGPIKPFLRWAGGKSLFVKSILERLPSKERVGKYYEPFLGAGSVFLAYQSKAAKLSDLNKQLIDTFAAIKENPRLVYRYLRELASEDSERNYYKIRDQYNHGSKSMKQAARFIYLNKTCFNGIFRVNTEGKFNVPYGYKKKIMLPSSEHLLSISRLLSNADLGVQNYKDAVSTASEGDLVYLDPPYPPINSSSYFTHYTKERFSQNDQCEVAEVADDLNVRGCFVLVTNADTEEIRRLYDGWYIHRIERTRWITSSKQKHKVGELIISNYVPKAEDADADNKRAD